MREAQRGRVQQPTRAGNLRAAGSQEVADPLRGASRRRPSSPPRRSRPVKSLQPPLPPPPPNHRHQKRRQPQNADRKRRLGPKPSQPIEHRLSTLARQPPARNRVRFVPKLTTLSANDSSPKRIALRA